MKPTFTLVGTALLAVSSPAHADHVGPASVDGNGGGMSVFGPDTLEAGKAGIGVRVTNLRSNKRSDEVLEELAEQDIHAHNSDYFLNTVFGGSYGATDRLTLSAQLPFARRDGLREGEHGHQDGEDHSEVVNLGNVTGVGDLSLLAKYRLLDQNETRLALIGGLKLPTAATHRRSLDGERLETEHQSGTGSWDFYAGAAFGTQFGWLALDASELYQFSGSGAQDTRLGDRLQAGIALSHRFGPPKRHSEAGSDQDHATKPHGHSSWDVFAEFTAEWEGRQKVAGQVELESGGTALWLTPGVRFNSEGGMSLGAAVGVPVWQDIRLTHPDNDFRLIFTVGKTL